MRKLGFTFIAGTLALLVMGFAPQAKAGDSDFKGYTAMPKASSSHPYTPAQSQKSQAYSPPGYTKMPPGPQSASSTANAGTGASDNSLAPVEKQSDRK